ncbi:hypothetical protein ABBQ32_006555 [Trebouxia sp. C0010 RCD-2024]
MRLALIPLLIAVQLTLIAQCDDDLEQQLTAAVADSNYTIQFASFIPLTDLPASEALQIAFVGIRLCGKGFVDVNGQVNRTLLQDVTELTSFNKSYYELGVTKAAAALAAPVVHVHGTGATADSSLQSSGLDPSLYECVDLELTLNAFRAAVHVDFGAVDQLWRSYAQQRLQAEGHNVACQVTTNLDVAPAAAPYLKQLGGRLAPSASFNFTLQVFSSVKLCCSVLDQSLVMSVLADLLAMATNLITLRLNSVVSYDTNPFEDYSNSANFSFTASSSTYFPVPSLSVALQEVLSNGTSSLFSQLMANWSVDAIAQAVDLRPCPGDSFSDQVLAYAAPPPPHADRPPLGLPVGSAIGAAFVLAVTATLCVYIHRQGKQKRQQQAKLAQAVQANADYHHNSGSTKSSSSLELTSAPVGTWSPADGVAAQPWDLDPAEITICKRSDGSDWVLGVGSFGQVVKGLRGGVQDVALKMLIGETHFQVNSFRQEIEILKSLSFDRSIVQFYGTCPWQGKTMLVLEHMEGGDLRQALTQAPAQLHWYNKGASVALDIIKGLHFLHKHKVVHMDMKPKNVLLTADYSIAKIADVGLAHMMGASSSSSPARGTFAYAAPEQLLSQHCNEKVDIYSFGVLLWELVTATPPIRGRLRPIKAPVECPQAIGDLIELCLSMDPQTRPSARDVFDVISRTQAAQDEQAAQDPWAC